MPKTVGENPSQVAGVSGQGTRVQIAFRWLASRQFPYAVPDPIGTIHTAPKPGKGRITGRNNRPLREHRDLTPGKSAMALFGVPSGLRGKSLHIVGLSRHAPKP